MVQMSPQDYKEKAGGLTSTSSCIFRPEDPNAEPRPQVLFMCIFLHDVHILLPIASCTMVYAFTHMTLLRALERGSVSSVEVKYFTNFGNVGCWNNPFHGPLQWWIQNLHLRGASKWLCMTLHDFRPTYTLSSKCKKLIFLFFLSIQVITQGQ